MECRRQFFVELDEYFFGHVGVGGNVAYTGAEYYFAFVVDVGSFDYGEVDVAVEAVAHFLRHFREVAVVVVAVVGVDAFTQVGYVLIGRTHVDSICARENAVDIVGSRRTGKYVYLEGSAGLVFAFGFFSKFYRDGFWCAGGGEAREAESHAIMNHFGCFGSCDVIECHS